MFGSKALQIADGNRRVQFLMLTFHLTIVNADIAQ